MHDLFLFFLNKILFCLNGITNLEGNWDTIKILGNMEHKKTHILFLGNRETHKNKGIGATWEGLIIAYVL